eukprot:291127-Chlamydomonas_euryale.AAC.1
MHKGCVPPAGARLARDDLVGGEGPRLGQAGVGGQGVGGVCSDMCVQGAAARQVWDGDDGLSEGQERRGEKHDQSKQTKTKLESPTTIPTCLIQDSLGNSTRTSPDIINPGSSKHTCMSAIVPSSPLYPPRPQYYQPWILKAHLHARKQARARDAAAALACVRALSA